jgi:alkanesulfonate monooxygenase SsuD/methylene tetrahydromethanopterin reductase-like flavin-dependent oxidoreductase (luciferase family)
MIILRFDMRAPGAGAEERADLYRAAIEMAAFADRAGSASIGVCEHHAATDGYLPSPLPMAAAIAAVTTSAPIVVAATLLPFYDPVRLAEDMIVIDHISRGRAMFTLGIGYRPEEYELYGLDFARRGPIADEKLAALLLHLSGASGVTPSPYTPGGPMLTWGGASKPAARRAGRNGIGFIAQGGDKAVLEATYNAAAEDAGHTPGLCMIPPVDMPASVFVHDDVDAGWAEVGPALLHDAMAYAEWNRSTGMADVTTSLSQSTTVEDLRAEHGSHRVVTTDEAVELVKQYGMLGLQPLCGGLDPEVAWPYLRRVVEEVLPRL